MILFVEQLAYELSIDWFSFRLSPTLARFGNDIVSNRRLSLLILGVNLGLILV